MTSYFDLNAAREAFSRHDEAGLRAALYKSQECNVDQQLLDQTDVFFPLIRNNRFVVATYDYSRIPADDEIVFIFGNYPHDFRNIIINNPIRRSFLDFWKFSYDIIISADCWRKVGAILIINLDERFDRYYSVLRELTRMGAPLQNVHRVQAARGPAGMERGLGGTVGCLQSHILAVEKCLELGCEHALILEDDFVFTDETSINQHKIGEFFRRDYQYKVCLLGTSKYGKIVPLDDLVAATFQKCTNAEAYFASRRGLMELQRCFQMALTRLLQTRDCIRYAADRCWAEMQDGSSFLVFFERLGLQGPGYSDIEREVTGYLD